MSDRSLLSDSYGLDHIASALALRESFESAIEATQAGQNIAAVCKIVEQPGMLDLSLALMQGEAQLTVGGEYLADRLKYYPNIWTYQPYHKSLTLDWGFMQEAELRGKNLAEKASQLPALHARHAETQLAYLINNGQVAATVPAYMDDTAGNALFSAAHLYGATTYDNLETTNYLTAAGNMEDNHDNLMNGITAWINAPDSDGKPGGFGNNLGNLMLVVSPNLWRVARVLTEGNTFVDSTGVLRPSEAAGIPWVQVPRLDNETCVLTRRPTDPVAGFYWGLDPWIHSAVKQPDADRATFKWTYARKWRVAPSTPLALYYLGA
jgi:hypothetical protein